jgi:hypothetical protein
MPDNVTIILFFLDAASRGMSRESRWFTPSIRPLGMATTDARGAFSLRLPANVDPAREEIRAAWAGSRSASTGYGRSALDIA